MKYFLVTYGCQMNRSDAERVAAVLEGLGFSPAADEGEAGILGVVACSVRQKSSDRVYGRGAAWNERRDAEGCRGRVVTFVTGCLLERDRKKLAKLFDIQFPIEELPRFPELLATHGISTFSQSVLYAQSGARTDYWKIAPQAASAHQAWIPIQNGCDRFCAYCAVPYTRGREVSRDAGEILDEIARLLEQGYRSFTLLGQNVNSYGRDWAGGEPEGRVQAGDAPGSQPRRDANRRPLQIATGRTAAERGHTDFVRLLDDAASLIEKSGREALLYFTSPHPIDMRREVFELMSAHPAIAHQVHLPMQSGDDAVLRRMRRSYTMERYREIVGWVRELVPDATLFTDIIVGFPGEAEAEFERTRQAMIEFDFDMAFIAAYSPRHGTAGAKLRDDVPRAEKSRRLAVLSELLKERGAAKKARLVGTPQRVLVDGVAGADVVSARTNGLIPVHVRVQGADAPGSQSLPDAPLERLVGRFIDVRIVAASALSLAAEYEDKRE